MADEESAGESDTSPTEEEPINTYVRGDSNTAKVDRPSSLAFHQFCSLSPLESFYNHERSEGDLRIISPPVRTILQHWPLTMVVMTALYLAIPLVEPQVNPVWAYLPQFTLEVVPWLVGLLVVWGILLATATRAEIIDGYGDLLKPVVIYSLFGFLLSGVGFSLFLVWQSESPAEIPANVVFGSGFLFAAYISGLIAYDLLIRFENMIENFGAKNIVGDEDKYNDVFLGTIGKKINRTFLRIPLSYIFGAAFTVQLMVFWHFQSGPHQLNSTIALICNVFFDTIVMIGVFQFLIFIRELNMLFEDRYESKGNTIKLEYQPFHPDGHGGFRDFGRAAMQVNVLVIVAGLYYVYRLFVQGVRALPAGGFSALNESNAVLWLVDFMGPIVLYVVVSAAWLYYTFWTVHLKMARDKEELILRRQSEKRHEKPVQHTLPIGALEDREGYEELLSSPVWPLDSRQIQTVVLTNIITVFLTLSSLPI
ncbi:hypothetical protein [Halorubellus salinus]|uniref:hypothetical protein n=1 Tax=Halorubellus salinus TaxID=755309 RepID=UPI001D0771A1|nr:hypothetical protein [Halorubellus salinus]